MNAPESSMDMILKALQERAKELECLYRVDEILRHADASLEEILMGVLAEIPHGYQYPSLCATRIRCEDLKIQSPNLVETSWVQTSDIRVEGETVGQIEVFYLEQAPQGDEGPFLKDERRLIDTLAERLGSFISHRKLRTAFQGIESARRAQAPSAPDTWRVIIEFLGRTDQDLLLRVIRKLLHHLSRLGVPEALEASRFVPFDSQDDDDLASDNRPLLPFPPDDPTELARRVLSIATDHLSHIQILDLIQNHIREDRARFFLTVVGDPDTTLDQVIQAITRLRHIPPEEIVFSQALKKGMRVALIEHFFTEQLAFVNVAKNFLEIESYFGIVDHIVHPPTSRGKLGGKSAGLFLAHEILKHAPDPDGHLARVMIPKTWYITTDALLDFIRYNDLEDVYSQKYSDIDQVRAEYPQIVQMFKRARFSPPIIKGLSTILDDLEGRPLIVRSSSLLEDRFGSAFSGKYKSLFLSNQGTKQERLAALTDAISEVYASVFAPDPIEYRAERGLIEVYEEMGILIQEVVGTKVGDYFLPSFAGVAFSRNEFRWSSRIRRKDGLVRLVPGLGTRAVDRLKDDYPVLLAPGQPNLRVNVTLDEAIRYSPKMVDVINLKTNTFESIKVEDLLRTVGSSLPQIANMVSIIDEDRLRRPIGREVDIDPERLVFSFEGLASGTPFIRQIQAILETLERSLKTPVDIEFASDGRDLYLLQCRPQSSAGDLAPAPIPSDLSAERILFTAKKFISNGAVTNITHIVYVDPDQYSAIETLDELRAVGRTIGRLNKILPKRQFILMGPGRWGSRGDIRLGVNVTYADISNTAVLIEIARKKGSYVPDLSFGTHFFQDLVESAIRYLPLYPDDAGIVFNETFLTDSKNILADLLPDAAELADVVRVIDVPSVVVGMVLRVHMNADADEAVGFLSRSQEAPVDLAIRPEQERGREDDHWRWRVRFAEKLAASLDPQRFGVKAIYLFGSTKNATAGPGSDIDILVHLQGSEEQRCELAHWLEGWSVCLAELNFLRTGHPSEGLLDVHFVSDEDIAARTSFAVKIGAVTDPARPLRMKDSGSG